MKQLRGEITIFLSLILLLVLELVGTCLESARAAGLAARVSMTASTSLQSVFAAYDRELWEQYGLLLFADSGRQSERLSAQMLSYAKANAEKPALGLDWFSGVPTRVLPSEVIYATDQHGGIFRQAVSEYMRICGITGIAEGVLSRLNLVNESGELTETGRQWQLRGGEEELDLEQIWNDYETIREEAERSVTGGDEEEEDAPRERDAEAEAVVEGVMGTVRNVLTYGLLGFVVEDVSSVSDVPLGGEELPSSLPEDLREGNSWALQANGWAEVLLFYEFILSELDCFRSEDRRGCQVEYVIAGKSSDRKNLASVALRLFALRYVLNQSFAFQDGARRAEAEALASAALGWTGLPPLVEGLTCLLLVALALGESVLDVRTLLGGGQVPAMKTAADWQASFQNLGALLGSFSGEIPSCENGLCYEDYLKVLLLLNSLEGITYRTMDVIQREVCKKEEGFRMKNCVYAAKAELTVSSSPVFPFLPGDFSYEIRQDAEYGYYDGA